MKLTPQQQFVMDKFNSNLLHNPCIHKHRKSKAWFQTNSRSWFEVSDQTIKALEIKGLIIKTDNTHWHLANN